MKIAIASDHAGFCLKEEIRKAYPDIEWQDFGAFSKDPVDYPDTGTPAAESVAQGNNEKGILICGSGIGMSIVANKVKGIRAALCWMPEIAKLSRQHNNANVLCLGARVVGPGLALEIVKTWLRTEFVGGRHLRRIEMF